jgi:NAD(P)-dependent dehydrogenase (short-subunit alcohol dehydrogenase family)
LSDFAGKRVLVTGSTRGVGRATAALFHRRGAAVLMHGRADHAVRAAAAELREGDGPRAVGIAADLERREECQRLAREAGEIDILVNCAAIYDEVAMAQSDAAFWDRMMAVNLTAPWLLSRALLPGLRHRRGVIVNVASEAALIGYANSSVYSASKGALVGLTKALAVELGPAVRAIAICPGPIDTDMAEAIFRRSPDPAATRRQWERTPMLRRIATAEEIAAAVVFAASPAAAYITGSVIVVDGGSTAGKRVEPPG